MSSARETVLIAQNLYEQLGPGGVVMADARADGLREAGDDRGAQYWREVSQAIVLISNHPSAVRRLESFGASAKTAAWSLMQCIEGYRHLASEADRVSRIAGSEGSEIERLAQGWLELAATMEALAPTLDLIAPPLAFNGGVYELN